MEKNGGAQPRVLPLRIGSVPYLNARPLVEGLGDVPHVTYQETIPADLAAGLRSGDLDVALVSSIEALRGDPARIVGDLSIASRGAVLSVKLLGRNDPRQARTVALDGASLTAATLTRIAYHTFWDRSRVQFVKVETAPDPARTGCDATLLIGDAALTRTRTAEKETGGEPWAQLDLGRVWTEATGLPFVWAVWLLKDVQAPPVTGATPGHSVIEPILQQAYHRGAAHIEQYARDAALQLGISRTLARAYLTDTIHYRMGCDEKSGLREFGRLARALPAVDEPGAV